jgi:hypothetical protein
MDQEAVVISPSQGQVKVFNEVGARIWELADGERSIADLVDIICEEYMVAREEAERDTLEFVQRLVDANLLTLAG